MAKRKSNFRTVNPMIAPQQTQWDISPYLDYRESLVVFPAVGNVVAPPDIRRIAIQFVANQVGPVIPLLANHAKVSTRQSIVTTEGYDVAFGVSPYFHVSQYGNLVWAQWYGLSVSGVLSLTVIEIYFKPQVFRSFPQRAELDQLARPFKLRGLTNGSR